ncbi:MAG: acetylserotonin O-methyltransferase [Nitrospirota bacterium]|nr:acetylserotonin O-methyltransferase [Nitrospirota bacterium]
MSKRDEQVNELRKIWGAFRASRVLLTANNFRIFDYLIKPQSSQTISKKLNIDLRATEILLDALTGLGLIKKQRGRYKNTQIASQFLVSGKPYYQGDIIRHADNLWKNWSGLDEVVKTGKPHRVARDLESFILGMHNLASLIVKDVIKIIGVKEVKTALDLGGGPGTYSIELAKKGVNVTLFDFPETIEIAKGVVEKEKIKGINFIQGDFVTDDIGKGYDLIFISQIFHAYSAKDNLQILKKCKKALNNGGRIVIQEFYISKDRTHPVQSALFSVNMLIGTEGGRCYSPEEIKSWFLKTGLKGIKEQHFDDKVLVSGVFNSSYQERKVL